MDNDLHAEDERENRKEQQACSPGSGESVESGSKKRLWHFIAGGGLLVFIGWALWYANTGSWVLSWDALTRKPAALINGEAIARSDLDDRITRNRIMVERQYGKDIFTGPQGTMLLAQVEGDVLERMLEERLVAQEARRMGIRVSDEEAREKVERIGTEVYGSPERFKTALREDGLSQEYLIGHIRHLLLCQEIKARKFSSQPDSDASFSSWLAQARGIAKVTVYRQTNPAGGVSGRGGGCCATGSPGGSSAAGCNGCGGTRRSAGPVSPELKSKASAAGLAEYRRTNPQAKGIEAKVTDYGCHIQVDIEKDGNVVKSYTYRDGRAFEI